jgi:alkylated DNA repair protein alkB family protein 1
VVQRTLLSRLLHRDLSDPTHKSNVHLHHHVEYPSEHASFFALSPNSHFTLQPKDSSVHKPIPLAQLLNKKLRWITLGGQYDWTNKVYPSEQPPEFPQDIAQLLGGLFPEMKPQAAIVNFYSPGDTLSLHRDVAEDCDQGLISISIGCDGIFIMGLEIDEPSATTLSAEGKGVKLLAIRLRSGDAVYMDGPSRFAWHGIPQVIPNTCPDWLKDWPAGNGEYEEWKEWMASKRINLNVRQMSY